MKESEIPSVQELMNDPGIANGVAEQAITNLDLHIKELNKHAGNCYIPAVGLSVVGGVAAFHLPTLAAFLIGLCLSPFILALFLAGLCFRRSAKKLKRNKENIQEALETFNKVMKKN